MLFVKYTFSSSYILQVSEAIDQSDGSIRILAGDHTEASNMITQENHSISNQNEELICVSMVPMVPAGE